MDTTNGIELLQKQIDAANCGRPDNLTAWQSISETAMRLVMGADHVLTTNFGNVGYHLGFATASTSQSDRDQAKVSGVLHAVSIIETAIFELKNSEIVPADGRANVDPNGSIFVVHGHDTGRLAETRLTLQHLTGKRAVVLHNQPSQGKTLIEKFERDAGAASFAVAILTPDDSGKAKDADDLQPRARQNVVFEAGYFMGILGRERVVILHEPEVEIPSDLNGIVYLSFGKGDDWKSELAKELNAAGIDADPNQL